MCVYVSEHTHTYIHVHVYTCTCIHTYLHTYVHTYIHTYTYIHIHVHTGSMDATLHLGFQRSISSLWQQAGRAGRRNHKSLSIYVAWDSPIDQFFLQHPEQLFNMPLEPTVLNLANADVLAPHLLCAASELPLTSADAAIFATPPLELPHDLFAARAAAAAAAAEISSDSSVGGVASAVASAGHDDHHVFENLVQHLCEKGHSSMGCLDVAAAPRPSEHAMGASATTLSIAGRDHRGSGGRQWAFIGGPKPQRMVSLRSIDDNRWSLQVCSAVYVLCFHSLSCSHAHEGTRALSLSHLSRALSLSLARSCSLSLYYAWNLRRKRLDAQYISIYSVCVCVCVCVCACVRAYADWA